MKALFSFKLYPISATRTDWSIKNMSSRVSQANHFKTGNSPTNCAHQELEWFNGVISTIDSRTFEPFQNISGIWLSHNKSSPRPDSGLFQHTRKLCNISFVNCLPEHVGHDLLIGLTNLTHAKFSSNSCIDAEARAPKEIQQLKQSK